MKIDWKEIYEGTITPAKVGTDMWGDESGAFEFAAVTVSSTQKTNKKFDLPIRPIPWSTDYNENVSFTLEWLIRDHRRDDIRLDDENVLEHVKDFWYRSTHFEGQYQHVCYPQDMLKFRTEYETTYARLVDLPASQMSSQCLSIRNRLRNLLWDGWKCIGVDGIHNRTDGKMTYKYACNRCCTPMPKAIKTFIKLKALQAKVSDESTL